MSRAISAPLLAAALIAAALLLSAHHDTAGSPVSPEPASRAVQSVSRPPEVAPRPVLRPVAADFVAAFLGYEVGAVTPSVRSAIRSTATRTFADDLLGQPPRVSPGSGALSPASLARLSIDILSSDPGRALVTGTATRPGGREEFAFLFEAQRGHWVAVAPAE
jgi:hypothetical protein